MRPVQDPELDVPARFVRAPRVVLLRARHDRAGRRARAGPADLPGDLPAVRRGRQHRHICLCGLRDGAPHVWQRAPRELQCISAAMVMTLPLNWCVCFIQVLHPGLATGNQCRKQFYINTGYVYRWT